MTLLTPQECAEKARVSLSLIYSVLKSGKLKAIRLGSKGRGVWRVEEEQFDLWLQSCRISEIVPQDNEGDYKFL